MFEGESGLTIEEESKIENQANIYSLIRTIDYVEWAFSQSHINKETLGEEVNTLLDLYKTVTEACDNFPGLDTFVKQYNLSNCKLGINRIKKGYVGSNKGGNLNLIASITNLFNALSNELYIFDTNGNDILVSDISSSINELVLLFDQAKTFIDNNDKDIKKIFDYNIKFRSMKASDKISISEIKQIQSDLNFAFQKYNSLLSNNK